MSISVAMAVYNGEKYVEAQINSILNQLKYGDEIVISYDESADNTYKIISKLKQKNNCIKILKGPQKGVIKNFENAILNCKNQYIFLCDQDDIWLSNKVETVLKEFYSTKADLVIHDALITDEKLQVIKESFFTTQKCKPGFLHNIIKNSYIGCCMAFNQELRSKILPFPESIPMHDQWIGIIAELKGKVSFLKIPLMYYRRHSGNITSIKHSDIISMIRYRIGLVKAIVKNA